MRRYLKGFLSLVLSSMIASPAFADFTYPVLVLDAVDSNTWPTNFRLTTTPLPSNTTVPSTGLNKMLVMGSAQFSEKQLGYVIAQIHPTTLMIFDLRQESHGFLNGNAISWYGINNQANLSKTPQQVEQDQFQRLSALQSMPQVTIEQIIQKSPDGRILTAKPFTLVPGSVFAEADLTRAYNFGYTRIYVPDEQKPANAQVDKFISVIQTLPSQTWIYIHCRAGRGRTTTFMAMLDMMRNAKNVSFADIIARQAIIGGIDLSKMPAPTDINYQAHVERFKFLQDFYQYCKESNFKTTWSAWSVQASKKPVNSTTTTINNKTGTVSSTATTATTTSAQTATPSSSATTTVTTVPHPAAAAAPSQTTVSTTIIPSQTAPVSTPSSTSNTITVPVPAPTTTPSTSTPILVTPPTTSATTTTTTTMPAAAPTQYQQPTE